VPKDVVFKSDITCTKSSLNASKYRVTLEALNMIPMDVETRRSEGQCEILVCTAQYTKVGFKQRTLNINTCSDVLHTYVR
jgi:hypothetical protein